MKRTHAFLSHDDSNDCDDDDCNLGTANDDNAAVDDDDAHYDGDHHGIIIKCPKDLWIDHKVVNISFIVHLNHKELILSSLAQSQGIMA